MMRAGARKRRLARQFTAGTALRKRALSSTVGIHPAPSGLKPVKYGKGMDEIIDQLVWHSLNQLARKGAFGGTSR